MCDAHATRLMVMDSWNVQSTSYYLSLLYSWYSVVGSWNSELYHACDGRKEKEILCKVILAY